MPGVPQCPDTEVLRHFLLGQLVPDELERLAGHLEGCARCVDSLTSLQDSDDLLRAMQSLPAGVPEPPSDLLERACALGSQDRSTWPGQSGQLLAQLAEQSSEVTQEVYDFLSPSRVPGELGRLGQYRVLRVLGAGGMGVVFEAEDTDLKRHVALKVLRPALAASVSARKRFLREGQAAATLSHDHVVPIFHVGEDRGIPYLTMPLLQGETLEQRLKRVPVLPPTEVLRIGQEIALALASAHAHGLIHRDIKPGNIFLEEARGKGQEASEEKTEGPASLASCPLPLASAQVKLLDFGLARAVGGDAHLTQSGVVVGTPAYMAPEQARGEAVDRRTDLFSLGCVLYRASTGRVPFPGANALATLLALAQGSPPSPARLNPRLPPGLSDLIMKLLAPRPEDRYPTAEAVVDALNAVAAGRINPGLGRRVAGVSAVVLICALGWVSYQIGAVLLSTADTVEPRKPQASAQPCHFGLQTTYPVGTQPYAVAVADFNGDGHQDLAVTNIASNNVSMLLGKGDGTFRSPLVQAAGPKPHGLAVADFNGDGKLDLGVAYLGGDAVGILLARGDGTFQPGASLAVGKNPRGVAVGDFDGDGKADLAVTNWKGNSVEMVLGNGDGTFRAANTYRAAGNPISVAVADFNGDSRPDLVVSNGDSNTVSVFLGEGNGSFRPAVHHGVGSGPGAVVVSDFNGDGHPDVAVENYGSDDVSVLLGDGDGTLRLAGSYGAGSGPGGLAVGDFNGDGVPDLVVANHHSYNLSVLLSRGDGTFRPAVPYAAGWTPAGLAVGDFNGDGRTDLAVANHKGHTVSVLLNQPPAPHFHVTFPLRVNVGEPYTLSLSARDAGQQSDTGYRGTVRLHSSDPRAVLPGEASFGPEDNGVLTRKVTLLTAGVQTLTVRDAASSERAGSITVMVVPLAAARLRVSAPARAQPGQACSVTVTAVDKEGDAALDYLGTVRFTSSDSRAVLPVDHSLEFPTKSGRRVKVEPIVRTPLGRRTPARSDRVDHCRTPRCTRRSPPAPAPVWRRGQRGSVPSSARPAASWLTCHRRERGRRPAALGTGRMGHRFNTGGSGRFSVCRSAEFPFFSFLFDVAPDLRTLE